MQMNMLRFLYFCLFFYILIGSCYINASEYSKSNQCCNWTTTFFRMPTKEQIEQFGSYDTKTQYDIFICGNQIIHPPAIYLARPFALEGEKVAKFLKKKLSQTKDDKTVRDIILVFMRMCILNSYDVSSNSELMSLIKDKAERIKDDDWRNVVEKMIDRAVEQCGGKI